MTHRRRRKDSVQPALSDEDHSPRPETYVIVKEIRSGGVIHSPGELCPVLSADELAEYLENRSIALLDENGSIVKPLDVFENAFQYLAPKRDAVCVFLIRRHRPDAALLKEILAHAENQSRFVLVQTLRLLLDIPIEPDEIPYPSNLW